MRIFKLFLFVDTNQEILSCSTISDQWLTSRNSMLVHCFCENNFLHILKFFLRKKAIFVRKVQAKQRISNEKKKTELNLRTQSGCFIVITIGQKAQKSIFMKCVWASPASPEVVIKWVPFYSQSLMKILYSFVTFVY